MLLFDYIDSNEDEALDIHEFTQAFFKESHDPDQ